MARPLGDYSRLLLDELAANGGGTSRELAERTGMSYGVASETLSNLARAGRVLKTDVRVEGVRRPVPRYDAAPQLALDMLGAVPAADEGLQGVAACPGWWAPVVVVLS